VTAGHDDITNVINNVVITHDIMLRVDDLFTDITNVINIVITHDIML